MYSASKLSLLYTSLFTVWVEDSMQTNKQQEKYKINTEKILIQQAVKLSNTIQPTF